MKLKIKSDLIIAASLMLSVVAPAANISLTASDPGGSSSLNSAGKWSDAQAPNAANDYYTSTFFARTPTGSGGVTFAGHSLTLQQVSGQGNPMRSILYKGGGGDTITINNLTNAAGGVLNNGGSGNVSAPTFTGNLWTIAGNSTVLSDQGSVIIGYPLAGSAVLTNTSGQGRTITYTGNLSGFNGKFFISSSCTVALNSGSSNLGNPGVSTPDQFTIGAGCTLLDNVGLTFNNANGGITLLGPGTATITAAGTTVISEPITDATNSVTSISAFTKSGAGTLTLNAVNTWSGTTTISAGILQIGNANAITNNGAVTDNGALDLNANSITIGTLGGSGSVDTVAGGTPTLTIGANNGNGTFTGVIQNSAGTLSLVKIGTGTQSIASYTYGGQTLVAGGTLNMTSAATVPVVAGDLVVSNGAAVAADVSSGISLPAKNLVVGTNCSLSLTLNSTATGMTNTGSLTFDDNATNNFAYGTVTANPTAPAISAAGGISAPGSNIVINLTATGLKVGVLTLIKYTGTPLANVANFQVNPPPGVAATLSNDTANAAIDLVIASTPNQLAWNGVSGASWDLATPSWTNLTSGGITVFQQYTNGSIVAGDSVLFDDTLTNDLVNPQPTNIVLNSRFYAFPVVVNGTLPYSLTGTGGIVGVTSLVKSNTGSLTLLTSNSFTGGVNLAGGSLIITNDSALGAGSGMVTLNSGTLQINGGLTNNRAMAMPVASAIGVATNVTARLTGVISGGGALSKSDNGTLVLAAVETLTGNVFGKGGTIVIDSGGSINNGGNYSSIGQNSSDVGALTVKGTGTFTNTGDFNVGDIDSSTGTLNLQDTAVVSVQNLFVASANNSGSTANGTVNMNGGTLIEKNTGAGNFVIGGRNAASSSGVGMINLTNGYISAAGGVRVGDYGTGTINQYGGTFEVTNGGTGINLHRENNSTSFGTYNLNGGTLRTEKVTTSFTSANSVFYFNGGTLQAGSGGLGATPFMNNLTHAYVRNSGAVINDNGYTIIISQALEHSAVGGDNAIDGGLTKSGAGTLTMTGANTFSGSITNKAGMLVLNGTSTYAGGLAVNAGTVQMLAASTIQGGTMVSNNATFSIVQTASETNNLGNLTFNGAASGLGGILALAPSIANNATVPLVNCGTLTLNGTNTMSLAAGGVGTIALLHYSAIAGAGNITNLTLPQGASGYISNNVPNATIYAVITSTGPGLVWTGGTNNLWDISTSTNWLLNAAITTYHQIVVPGDAVTFSDSGSGTVVVNTNVGPASLVISNITKTYTFSGTKGISGPTSLLKLGSGAAVLNLTNDTYTGNTTISNGILQVGNSGVGSSLSPSANLVIGASGTLQLSAQLANVTTTVGEFTGSGAIHYTGGNNSILSFGGSVGGTWNGTIYDDNGGGISLTKSGSGTWVIGGVNHLDNGDYFNAISQNQFNGGTTIITNGGVLSIANTEFWVAQGAGSTGTVVVAGGSIVVSNDWLAVGRGDATANGTLIVNSGTVRKLGANDLVVGSSGSTGTLIVNGGQVLNNSDLWLGENTGANGTLYLNGGLVQAIVVRPNGTAPTTSVAYFNGGTLQATTNSVSFLQSSSMVMSNGLVLDDGGWAVSIGAVPLEAGDAFGGGLVKKGAGAVYLDTANTYVGTTVVSNGLLAGIGSIAGPVVVTPTGNLGAGDAAGLGTLTISSNLTLHGNATLRIDKETGSTNSDLITGIATANYGGTLTVSNLSGVALAGGEQFTLFSATGQSGNFSSIAGSPGGGLSYSFNPASGVLSVVAIASNPTNITFSVSGNTMMLSWPSDHLGWILQQQVNGLNVGLSTNWVDVAGSASVTSTNILINSSSPSAFYRLRHP